MQQPRAHHHRHSNHLPQLLLPPSLVPGQPHVLISPVVDGVLVSSAGCVAYLFRTQTVNHRDTVTTLPSATGTTLRHVITIIQARLGALECCASTELTCFTISCPSVLYRCTVCPASFATFLFLNRSCFNACVDLAVHFIARDICRYTALIASHYVLGTQFLCRCLRLSRTNDCRACFHNCTKLSLLSLACISSLSLVLLDPINRCPSFFYKRRIYFPTSSI
jgi:hypothetical protein